MTRCAHCHQPCNDAFPWTMFQGNPWHVQCEEGKHKEEQRVLSHLPKSKLESVATVPYGTPARLSDLIGGLEGITIHSDSGISIDREVPLVYAVVETSENGDLVEVLQIMNGIAMVVDTTEDKPPYLIAEACLRVLSCQPSA